MSAARLHDKRRVPFFMVGKPDLHRLAESCESRMLPYARSVYFALLEIANDHRTEEISASRGDLAAAAGVSVATLKRCVAALVDAQLVTVEEVPGYPNIWTLLDAEGGSDRAGGGGSTRAGGRLQQSRGVGLTEPPLKETGQEGKKEVSDETSKTPRTEPVGEVWAHYQRTFPSGAAQRKLSGERRLVIERALKVRSMEKCKAAISALSQSEFHVRGGFTDIRYALRGGKVADPEATIDRLLAQAGNGSNGNGNSHAPVDELRRHLYGGVRFDDLPRHQRENIVESFQMGYKPWEEGAAREPDGTPTGPPVVNGVIAPGMLC